MSVEAGQTQSSPAVAAVPDTTVWLAGCIVIAGGTATRPIRLPVKSENHMWRSWPRAIPSPRYWPWAEEFGDYPARRDLTDLAADTFGNQRLPSGPVAMSFGCGLP